MPPACPGCPPPPWDGPEPTPVATMRRRSPRREVTLTAADDPDAVLALANRVVRHAWGEWLYAYAWSHFVTICLPPGPSPSDGLAIFTRGVRQLAGYSQRPVSWACSVERGRRSGLTHVHALVGGLEALSVLEVSRPWRWTIEQCRVYDPTRGAAWYVSKEQSGADAVFERSRRFPSLRMRAA